MDNIRFSDRFLNSLLMLCIRPQETQLFVTKFSDARVIVNLSTFVESQCRCNILSKYLGIDRELFVSGRKFLHSCVDETEYRNLELPQAEFKELCIVFKRLMAFLNLLFVSMFDTKVVVVPTIPLKVKEFIETLNGNSDDLSELSNSEDLGDSDDSEIPDELSERDSAKDSEDRFSESMVDTDVYEDDEIFDNDIEEFPSNSGSAMCITPSNMITFLGSSEIVVDYLLGNPEAFESVLQHVLQYANQLRFVIDYRKVVQLFKSRKNQVLADAIVDLYFCKNNQVQWKVEQYEY